MKLPQLEPEKRDLLIAVLLAMLLSSLDQTIVSTAMPRVVQHLGGLDIFSWVFSAYMIASTITIMLSGKLGDMIGRKNVYFYGVLGFVVGSVLSGMSPNMIALIIFRGVQGIGAGVMMVSAMAMLGDIFSPAERGKWQGAIGAVFALASVIGPLVGAVITEQFGWRWIFFINLPLGVLVMYLLSNAKHAQNKIHAHQLDIRGAALFSMFIISFMVYLISGLGSSNPAYYALLGFAICCLVLFIREEMRATEPILPPDLFSNQTFLICAPAAFVLAMAMFGGVTFLPLLMEYGLGKNTSESGFTLTPLMLAIILASSVAGQIISRTGRYKATGIAGSGLVTLGLYMFSSMGTGTPVSDWMLLTSTIILGLGVGTTLPLVIVVVQNTFEHKRIGTVTAAVSFFRTLGGAIGVAVMGAMLNLHGANNTPPINGPVANATILSGLGQAFNLAFILSFIPIILFMMLTEVPLRKGHEMPVAERVGKGLVEEEGMFDAERSKQIEQ